MLQELLKNLAGVIPTLFAAITLLAAGYFISNVISRVVTMALAKIGVDKLADKLNEIDVIQQYNVSIRPSIVVGQIVKYFLTLIFLIMATDVLGMAAVSQLVRDVINYVPSAITALVVMIFALFIANALKGLSDPSQTVTLRPLRRPSNLHIRRPSRLVPALYGQSSRVWSQIGHSTRSASCRPPPPSCSGYDGSAVERTRRAVAPAAKRA